MTALQWTDVPHIDEIDGISDEDREVLEEIREVLARHDRLNKFGIALLHYHFNLNEDEILVEYCDAPNRTLTTRTLLARDMDPSGLIETIWRFDTFKGAACKKWCPKDPDNTNQHAGYPEHKSAEPTPPTTPTPSPSTPPSSNAI